MGGFVRFIGTVKLFVADSLVVYALAVLAPELGTGALRDLGGAIFQSFIAVIATIVFLVALVRLSYTFCIPARELVRTARSVRCKGHG